MWRRRPRRRSARRSGSDRRPSSRARTGARVQIDCRRETARRPAGPARPGAALHLRRRRRLAGRVGLTGGSAAQHAASTASSPRPRGPPTRRIATDHARSTRPQRARNVVTADVRQKRALWQRDRNARHWLSRCEVTREPDGRRRRMTDEQGPALPTRADRHVRTGVPGAAIVVARWPRAGDDPRPGGLLRRRPRHPAGRRAPQGHARHRAGGVVRDRRTAGLPVAAAADDVQDRPLHRTTTIPS